MEAGVVSQELIDTKPLGLDFSSQPSRASMGQLFGDLSMVGEKKKGTD